MEAILRRVIATVLALGTAGVCVRLGLWQIDRHEQRKASNAVIAARIEQDTVVLRSADLPDSMEYRMIRAVGVFDRSREIVEQGRAVNGMPAVYVATPLVTPEGFAVLVERGWAPSASARSVDLVALREPDTSHVEGMLLRLDGGSVPSDTSWPLYVRRADPVVLQPLFPYPLAPLVLRRTILPPGAPAGLRPAPLPQLTAGPHLSYALQWFAFAMIAVIGPLIAAGVFTKRARPRNTDAWPLLTSTRPDAK